MHLTALTPLLALLPSISAGLIPRQQTANASTISNVNSASSVVAPISSSAASSAAVASSSSGGAGGGSSGSSLPAPRATFYPLNSLQEGVTVNGVRNLNFATDAYLGIPFSSPPTGNNRFRPPSAPTWNTTSFNATKQPPACLQRNSTTYGTYGYSEDCLYLNVFTPAGANAQTAYLPVFVWVYGGAFTSGAASLYNASLLNAAGVQSGRPFISVILNYRLGFFGWPNGEQSAANGAANLGLRDVIAGLEWTRDNIWAWGGDPSRVTVAGESAGAIAISLLFLRPDLNLFRSAIIQSGGPSTTPILPTAQSWQGVYDLLVSSTGCNSTSSSTNSTNSTSSTGSSRSGNSTSGYANSWECLRALPAAQLLAAQAAIQNSTRYGGSNVFSPSIDYDLIPDSPHKLVGSGQFANKPMINGNCRDEGTAFVPTAITSALVPTLLQALEPKPLSNDTLQQLLQLYPDVPALGSPYYTGNNTFGLNSGFKQASSIVGDVAFQSQRRWFIRNTNQYFSSTPVYSYLFNQSTPGARPYQGIYHGSDVPYTFGLTYLGGNYTAEDRNVTQTMFSYWINFIYYQNPNGANLTNWPAYTSSSQNLLQLQANNYTVIADDFRESGTSFINNNPTQFNAKRSLAEDIF